MSHGVRRKYDRYEARPRRQRWIETWGAQGLDQALMILVSTPIGSNSGTIIMVHMLPVAKRFEIERGIRNAY